MNARWIATLWVGLSTIGLAQTKPADTVVVRVGEGSKIVVTVRDKKDLYTMKQYDFQKLMSDLLARLEAQDTTPSQTPAAAYRKQEETTEWIVQRQDKWTERHTGSGEEAQTHSHWKRRRTYHSLNVDIGTNNYLENGRFPNRDNRQYTVRPWGSWYVGINSIQRTRLANRFFLEWGAGVSWYNFKFQDASTVMSKDNNTVLFGSDPRDIYFEKSKLTAAYVNASLVPVLDFGSNRRKPSLLDGSEARSFRIGLGPYVGYRIGSYTKNVFEENGDERKPRNHDHFYLNNLRYGMRLQVGYDDVDFFVNYDMNELFIENRGPRLNAFSFGITF
ncbi:MAG: hypothetical protein MUC38_02580 [Cyclobacteriaceae bacterium]|jgi:hypothetical protein|nr:hypothetical protein [Cyclobacteriaceae bacterium]